FAVVAGEQIPVSIGRLFIAGIVPGILIGLGLVAAALFVRWRSDRKTMKEATNETQSNFKQVKEKRASFTEIMSALLDALSGLLIPVIILGGIYDGIFTPPELTVVSVFYG